MKFAARVPLTLLAGITMVLAGCVYAPVMQRSQQFDRHPGVSLEVWSQYDYYGYGYQVTTVINRSNMPKCVWTEVHSGRLLRPGESWEVGRGPSPGNVGVSNVTPQDPGCVNAKQVFGGPAR